MALSEKKAIVCWLLCLLFFMFSAGCGETKGTRDNSPVVPGETADGLVTYGNDVVAIDASHTDQGYIMVKYTGSNERVRLQVTAASDTIYTYILYPGSDFQVFPLTEGSGSYRISLYENIAGDKYAQVYSVALNVTTQDQFVPFLHSNQYVKYTADSECVELGAELAAPADNDLDVVEAVYDYIVDNISYDYHRAENVDTGYLPDIDKVLEEGKGICFDYAALATAMLRSQAIPTRLVIGYAGSAYHAWISVYIEDVGWVNNAIEFKGTDWVRMDPTYDANASTLDKYIGSGADYNQMYLY